MRPIVGRAACLTPVNFAPPAGTGTVLSGGEDLAVQVQQRRDIVRCRVLDLELDG
jgi:hypothetical protein